MTALERLRHPGVDVRLDSLGLRMRAHEAETTDEMITDAVEHRDELIEGLIAQHRPDH